MTKKTHQTIWYSVDPTKTGKLLENELHNWWLCSWSSRLVKCTQSCIWAGLQW